MENAARAARRVLHGGEAGRSRTPWSGDERLHRPTRYVRRCRSSSRGSGKPASGSRWGTGRSSSTRSSPSTRRACTRRRPSTTTGSGVDWLLVTHEHIDHLDPYSLREVSARSEAPHDRRARAARAAAEAAPDASFTGVDRGDRVELPGAGVCTVVPAIHGPTVGHGYPDDPAFVGYVFELAGTSLYHAGDTIVTDLLVAAPTPLAIDVAPCPSTAGRTSASARTWSGTWVPRRGGARRRDRRHDPRPRTTGTCSAATPSGPGRSATRRPRPTRRCTCSPSVAECRAP